MNFKQHELQAIAEEATRQASKYWKKAETAKEKGLNSKYITSLSLYRTWQAISIKAIDQFINYKDE